MTRRSLSGLVILAAGGHAFGLSSAALLSDESDRKTWNWLLKRFGEKEAVKKKGNKVELIGMTNKGPYDVAIMLDSKGRVVKARFNHANFTNDEWQKLAGFKHLIDLTCWHNFKSVRKGQPHPNYEEEHPLSGSGLIAFQSHPLQNLNIGGSSFNNHGLSALTKLPNFKRIKAYHTKVNDEGVRVLEGNTNLHFLNLGPQFSMRITEASLESIGKMKSLRELEFNETFVSWENGLAHLIPLKAQLKRVKLDKTWIEEPCLERARKAFPKTTFEHSMPDQKSIEQMKRRML
ncbi:MAG: hypothetical protein P1V20_08005 [Verrucomicrobiales bacterium]|nr:hypothetical protein [Verrucomicrobiales bacterium]